MKTINQPIINLVDLIIKQTLTAPSVKVRVLDKLANLTAFFKLSTILDEFVYTTAEQQEQQQLKRGHLDNFMSYLLENGLSPTGVEKAYQDAFKYSKTRSFKEKTLAADAIALLVACGETEEDIQKSLKIDNATALIRFEAQQQTLETHNDYIKRKLTTLSNAADNASGELTALPTWLAKSIINKTQATVENQRRYLRNGVLKGITTSGNDLFIINQEINPRIMGKYSRAIDLCIELEQETDEPS